MALEKLIHNRRARSCSSAQWAKGLHAVSAPGSHSATAMFQPDILACQQYLSTCLRSFDFAPEKVLMFAILQDAIDCLHGSVVPETKQRRRLASEAYVWFANRDGNYLYSFENICSVLGLDSGYLRRGILGHHRTQTAFKKKRAFSKPGVDLIPVV